MIYMKYENSEEEREAVVVTKSEIVAERILKRIHVHDVDVGGVFTEITGSQGSGKTSVLLSFMDYTMKQYPDEKIFWSSCYNAPLQFVKIGKERFHVMVKQDSGVRFYDRGNKLTRIELPVTFFSDYHDLYDKTLPGTCNAVFFGDRFRWMEFLHHLRSVGEWCHIYIDEISEICPSFTCGKLWHRIGEFSMDLKEVRKCMMNVHMNTQSVSDIDHRVRTKVMVKVYMPGAHADTISRITQVAIDNLEEDSLHGNEAYLEYSGKFGRTRFKDIYRPIPGLQWEARIDGK